MGLDMYLLKRGGKLPNNTQRTGACGGLFCIAPVSDKNEMEIGYWRKDYDLNDLILSIINKNDSDPNLVKYNISLNKCLKIINECKRKVYYAKEKYDQEEVDHWNYNIQIFENAYKYLLEEGVSIFYQIWY